MKPLRAALTLPLLRSVLAYDPSNGEFTWKRGVNANTPAGNRAGGLTRKGYRSVSIGGRRYYAHRLAWFYTYGDWPPEQIDHINGDPDDNRLSNLRLASNAQNNRNKQSRHKSDGAPSGVTWNSQRGKWRARIRIDCKEKFLGHFNTIEAAEAAYKKAAREHFGSFAPQLTA